MQGIKSFKSEAPIYATSLSALIIRKQFPHLEQNLRILEMGQATAVVVMKDDRTEALNHFTVTAIPAGHCIGSCMLLFQIEGADVLYTGDFRMLLKDAISLSHLNEIRSNGNVIVYLDSTFMKTSYPSFPSQTDSVMKINELVRNFLKKSKTHKGELATSRIDVN
jgi:Cft2 family RNA processing exonuclease